MFPLEKGERSLPARPGAAGTSHARLFFNFLDLGGTLFDDDVPTSRCLLQGAELSLASGRRYGLIGRNGLGKTTLLKMLASRNLRVPAHISILHVEQEVAGDETTALQSVLESDTLREGLLREEKSLNARIANGT